MELTARQQEILEASLTVIDRDGLKKFTMKNVAQEIGVTDAALYKHFPDKGAILGALATLFKESTLDILAEIRANPGVPALGKLELFLKGRARQFQENRALTVTLFSEELFRGVASVTSINSDTMESHAELLMEIVQEGQATGSVRADLPPQHLVLLLTGPMRLMVTAWKTAPDGGPTLVQRVEGFWKTYQKIAQG
jgi:AcrR family transcriptional regulator